MSKLQHRWVVNAAEAKELIGGYSIVEASSYDEAAAIARECPITYVPDYSIEIREMMEY